MIHLRRPFSIFSTIYAEDGGGYMSWTATGASFGILISTAAIVFGDPPQHPAVENIVARYAKVCASAENFRDKGISTARADAVKSLSSIAKDFYSKKDRVGETAAWRAALMLDPSCEAARLYFTDLGTLQTELDQFGEVGQPGGNSRWLLGTTWKCRWNTGLSQIVSFGSNLKVEKLSVKKGAAPELGKITELGADYLLVEFDKSIEKYSWASGKVLGEQWYPKSSYPTTDSGGFAIGEPYFKKD
jgi:hypothetical protein